MQLLPLSNEKTLLISPIHESNIDKSDIIIKVLSEIRKIGRVEETCSGSAYKKGDVIEYPFPKEDGEYDFKFEGKLYHLIPEYLCSTWNGEPTQWVFVEPISNIELSDSGLMLPKDASITTQKGRIIAAPPDSIYEKNATIEYRRHKTLFPKVRYKGIECDAIYPKDIFRYRGKCAPHRMIIRFEIEEQKKKYNRLASGILIHPAFKFMMYHLQYGEIAEIGSEAARLFPEITVGCFVLIHHTVESDHQSFRHLGRDDKYQYRVLNAHSRKNSDKEILGVIKFDKLGKQTITPLNNWVFLSADIKVFERLQTEMTLVNDPIHSATSISDIVSSAERKVDSAVKSYEENMKRLNYEASILEGRINKEIDVEQNISALLEVESDIARLKQHQMAVLPIYKRNMLVTTKQIFPPRENEVVVPYQQLYPIEIKGKSYLVALESFIVAEI